jgi:hypothetical protein
MYCPKCGNKMVSKHNSMYCEAGQMMLGKTLFARFQARFVEHVPEEPLLRRVSKPRGQFFCPDCGKPLKFIDGYLACPDGHGSLNDCLFDLNTLHAHDKVHG